MYHAQQVFYLCGFLSLEGNPQYFMGVFFYHLLSLWFPPTGRQSSILHGCVLLSSSIFVVSYHWKAILNTSWVCSSIIFYLCGFLPLEGNPQYFMGVFFYHLLSLWFPTTGRQSSILHGCVLLSSSIFVVSYHWKAILNTSWVCSSIIFYLYGFLPLEGNPQYFMGVFFYHLLSCGFLPLEGNPQEFMGVFFYHLLSCGFLPLEGNPQNFMGVFFYHLLSLWFPTTGRQSSILHGCVLLSSSIFVVSYHWKAILNTSWVCSSITFYLCGFLPLEGNPQYFMGVFFYHLLSLWFPTTGRQSSILHGCVLLSSSILWFPPTGRQSSILHGCVLLSSSILWFPTTGRQSSILHGCVLLSSSILWFPPTGRQSSILHGCVLLSSSIFVVSYHWKAILNTSWVCSSIIFYLCGFLPLEGNPQYFMGVFFYHLLSLWFPTTGRQSSILHGCVLLSSSIFVVSYHWKAILNTSWVCSSIIFYLCGFLPLEGNPQYFMGVFFYHLLSLWFPTTGRQSSILHGCVLLSSSILWFPITGRQSSILHGCVLLSSSIFVVSYHWKAILNTSWVCSSIIFYLGGFLPLEGNLYASYYFMCVGVCSSIIFYLCGFLPLEGNPQYFMGVFFYHLLSCGFLPLEGNPQYFMGVFFYHLLSCGFLPLEGNPQCFMGVFFYHLLSCGFLPLEGNPQYFMGVFFYHLLSLWFPTTGRQSSILHGCVLLSSSIFVVSYHWKAILNTSWVCSSIIFYLVVSSHWKAILNTSWVCSSIIFYLCGFLALEGNLYVSYYFMCVGVCSSIIFYLCDFLPLEGNLYASYYFMCVGACSSIIFYLCGFLPLEGNLYASYYFMCVGVCSSIIFYLCGFLPLGGNLYASYYFMCVGACSSIICHLCGFLPLAGNPQYFMGVFFYHLLSCGFLPLEGNLYASYYFMCVGVCSSIIFFLCGFLPLEGNLYASYYFMCVGVCSSIICYLCGFLPLAGNPQYFMGVFFYHLLSLWFPRTGRQSLCFILLHVCGGVFFYHLLSLWCPPTHWKAISMLHITSCVWGCVLLSSSIFVVSSHWKAILNTSWVCSSIIFYLGGFLPLEGNLYASYYFMCVGVCSSIIFYLCGFLPLEGNPQYFMGVFFYHLLSCGFLPLDGNLYTSYVFMGVWVCSSIIFYLAVSCHCPIVSNSLG